MLNYPLGIVYSCLWTPQNSDRLEKMLVVCRIPVALKHVGIHTFSEPFKQVILLICGVFPPFSISMYYPLYSGASTASAASSSICTICAGCVWLMWWFLILAVYLIYARTILRFLYCSQQYTLTMYGYFSGSGIYSGILNHSYQ